MRILCSLLAACTLTLAAAANAAPTVDPAAFVQSMYDQAIGRNDPVYGAKSKADILRWFAPPLADLIWKDLVEADGEVGRMDGHYLYDAQDDEIRNLKIVTLVHGADRARVRSTFEFPPALITIEFDLVAVNDQWRVANIHYGSGTSYIDILSVPFPVAIDDEASATVLCKSREAYQVKLPEGVKPDVAAEDEHQVCVDSLYGTGGEARDPMRTLRCCVAVGSCNREIAIIFANGWGVPRDVNAAIHFLCKAQNQLADAELWDMLDHVEKIRREETEEELDFCNYAISSSGAYECALRRLDLEAPALEARFTEVQKSAGDAAQALETLRERSTKFVSEEATWLGEETRGGTIHNANLIAFVVQTEKQFLDKLERFSRERAPAATADAVKRADAELNRAYRKTMAGIPPCDAEYDSCSAGETSQDYLRDAQRAWIAYRDAFAAYYVARWRGAAPEDALRREILRALTRSRIEELAAARV